MATPQKTESKSMELSRDMGSCELNLPPCIEKDALIVKRSINYPSGIVDQNRREIIVELDIYLKFTRETKGLALGDPIYTQTLLPNESVSIQSSDRRTQFSFDSESQLSYKSVQMSESQYFMSALRHFTADSSAEQSGSASSSNEGKWNFHGDASAGLDLLGLGGSASTNANYSYNNHSFGEYLNTQKAHAETAESNSLEATHKALSVSVGQVSTRTRQEGTTSEHYESTSRTFKNENRCHALTYLFYRINKMQTISFEVSSIEIRVKDPNSLTGYTHLKPVKSYISLIPQYLPVSSSKTLEALKIQQSFAALDARPNVGVADRDPLLIGRPLFDALLRRKAVEKVKKELMEEGILKEDGTLFPKMTERLNFTKESCIPTAGVMVKGYLDSCDMCEPELKERYQLENDNLRLKNDLLKRQIELLDKSQEYRCCPCDEVTPSV